MSDVDERPEDDVRLAAGPPDHRPHDEDGNLKPAFVDAVEAAVNARERDALLGLVGDMHEADLGGLIEALEPGTPPRADRHSSGATSTSRH